MIWATVGIILNNKQMSTDTASCLRDSGMGYDINYLMPKLCGVHGTLRPAPIIDTLSIYSIRGDGRGSLISLSYEAELSPECWSPL